MIRVCAAVFALLVAISPIRAQPTTAPAPADEKLDAWWADLAKNEPESAKALLNFSGRPDDAVAYFKGHLKPLKISEDDLVKALIDLNSDDADVWRPAFEMLEYFDPRLTLDLEKLMADMKDPPGRTRLVEILCDYPPGTLNARGNIGLRKFKKEEGFNFFADNASWWAEWRVAKLTDRDTGGKKQWVRALRAITLLQYIASPDAIDLLKDMTTGHPDASPTKAALNSLSELGVEVKSP